MRIDEFKKSPTGSLSIADRIRLLCIGFDIAPKKKKKSFWDFFSVLIGLFFK